MERLESAIFNIQSQDDFEKCALSVYRFQRENCEVYGQFIDQLNRPEPNSVQEIPFLPISFFKTHEIRSHRREIEATFLSSGTTGMVRSKHLVESVAMYEKSFSEIYLNQVGDPANQIILALLPNYVDQGNSSLVYMVDHLIKKTKHKLSGFYLSSLQDLLHAYSFAIEEKKQVVLFGVSYALLDLAEMRPDLSQAIVIETGGMKGRRAEMTKSELHLILSKSFNLPYISSEYGMTELLSQAYSDQNGLFDLPPWMQVLIRDVNDPFEYLANEKTGGINVVDLANLYSCSFISTQDLGKITGNQLQLMGRFDHSDIRGCNLMVE